MAQYAPAGGVLLAIGGTAALASHDAVLIVGTAALLLLMIGFGWALQHGARRRTGT